MVTHQDWTCIVVLHCIMLYLNFSRLYLYLCLVIHYRAMIYSLDLKGTVVAIMQSLLLMSRLGVLLCGLRCH